VGSLECAECGRVSRENERGWTARLTHDDEVAVYGPDCDDREFSTSGECDFGYVRLCRSAPAGDGIENGMAFA
jgi:hypothetical protein